MIRVNFWCSMQCPALGAWMSSFVKDTLVNCHCCGRISPIIRWSFCINCSSSFSWLTTSTCYRNCTCKKWKKKINSRKSFMLFAVFHLSHWHISWDSNVLHYSCWHYTMPMKSYRMCSNWLIYSIVTRNWQNCIWSTKHFSLQHASVQWCWPCLHCFTASKAVLKRRSHWLAYSYCKDIWFSNSSITYWKQNGRDWLKSIWHVNVMQRRPLALRRRKKIVKRKVIYPKQTKTQSRVNCTNPRNWSNVNHLHKMIIFRTIIWSRSKKKEKKMDAHAGFNEIKTRKKKKFKMKTSKIKCCTLYIYWLANYVELRLNMSWSVCRSTVVIYCKIGEFRS